MRYRGRSILLGIYDVILATGAVWSGMTMTKWTEYPDEWASRLPFDSWFMPGVLAILIFGLGNLIAAIFCLKRNHNSSWAVSTVMGSIFFVSLIFQVIVLREWYLATVEFFVLSVVQLCLSGYAFFGFRKSLNITKA